MELNLTWHRHVALQYASISNDIYQLPIDRVPELPGIYMFLRVHGRNYEALYIGQATSLKSRISQQLNNVRLMRGIENAANGRRILMFAEFRAKRGQSSRPSLARIEKALIRHFLSDGHQLLNIRGTRIVKHSLKSDRPELRRLIPDLLYFEE